MYIHNFLVLPRMLLFNYGNFAQCRFATAPISEALVSSVSRRVGCHLCAIFHHGSGTVLMLLHVVLLVLGEVEMIFLSFSILTVLWLLFCCLKLLTLTVESALASHAHVFHAARALARCVERGDFTIFGLDLIQLDAHITSLSVTFVSCQSAELIF
jgi:hypothetical protein